MRSLKEAEAGWQTLAKFSDYSNLKASVRTPEATQTTFLRSIYWKVCHEQMKTTSGLMLVVGISAFQDLRLL